MKIDYFNYLYDLEGISIGSYIKGLELMNALETRGHLVKKYWRLGDESTANEKSNSVRQILKAHLHRYLHEPSQIFKNIKFYIEEQKILNTDTPDILIARLESYLFSPLIYVRKMDIPFIVEADSPVVYELDNFGPDYIRIPHLAEKLEADFVKKADMAFCVSNTLKEYFVKRGVPEEKLRVITNGADLNRFNPDISSSEVEEKYNLRDRIVVGFVGSFHYWHGVDQLIDLIKGLILEFDNVSFLLVGSGGPMAGELKNFIRSENLTNRMILTGHVPHESVPKYISAMDIVLAPYPDLRFFYYSPVKIFEYMACGKAVVSSKIGQIAEVIEHGVDGILCTPGDVQAMKDSVRNLILNKEKRLSMGTAASTKVRLSYSWQKKAEELESLCMDVLEKRRSIRSSQ